MAYPAWVAPQAMDVFGGFRGGFDAGQRARQTELAEFNEQAGRQGFGQYVGWLSNQGQASGAGQPMGFLGSMGQSSPDVVAGSHAAAQGASVPELQGGLESYIANARAAESGGNPNAKNPRSSATGLYQFTSGTWNDLMRQYPNLGLTPDGRTDPAQQERAMRQFTLGNAQSLAAANLPVTPGTLYASHFLGAGGARQVLSQPDTAPMASVVSAEVINANPFLRNMSVGDFKQWSDSKGGGANGGYAPPRDASEAAAALATGGQPEQQAQGSPAMAFAAPGSPAAPVGALPPAEVMNALFRSPETRQMAISLAQTAQQGLQPPEFTQFQREDGSIWQMNTRTGEMGQLQAATKAATPTSLMQNLEAAGLQPGTEEYQQAVLDNLTRSQSTVNVTGQSARDQADAALLKDIQDNYATALRLQPAIIRAKDAVMAAPDGYAGNMSSLWGSIAGGLGLEVPEGASESQVLSSITTQLAGLYRLPGPVSDAEMQLYMQAAPRLGDTKAANLAKIELFEKLMDRSGDIVRIARQYAGTDELYDRLSELNEPIFTPEERAQLERAAGQRRGEAPQQSQVTQVNTRQEYDALPAGATYLAPDGTIRTKP